MVATDSSEVHVTSTVAGLNYTLGFTQQPRVLLRNQHASQPRHLLVLRLGCLLSALGLRLTALHRRGGPGSSPSHAPSLPASPPMAPGRSAQGRHLKVQPQSTSVGAGGLNRLQILAARSNGTVCDQMRCCTPTQHGGRSVQSQAHREACHSLCLHGRG